MKVLLGMRMKALVLGMVVVMSLGSAAHGRKNGFHVLCEVLRSAERVLNDTGRKDGQLKEALYGKSGGVVTVENGKVSVMGTFNGHRNRGLLCTYYDRGTYSCFAESLAGTLLCTCTPGQSGGNFCGLGSLKHIGTWSGGRLDQKNELFQEVWDNINKKCPYGDGNARGTEGKMSALEEAVKKVRGAMKEGRTTTQTLFYIGEGGAGYCGGTSRNDVCAAYHQGRSKGKHDVHIPWLSKIQNAIEILKQREHPTEATPTLQSVSGTSPAPTTNTHAELAEVEHSEPSNKADTTSEEKMEETHPTENPSPEHPEIPKGRTRRSTTEGPEATSTATEDTSPTDEPEILDPTAAPFPPADGADILTPLGLFMAASSFF